MIRGKPASWSGISAQDTEFTVSCKNRSISLQLQPAVIGIYLADSCHFAAGRDDHLASRRDQMFIENIFIHNAFACSRIAFLTIRTTRRGLSRLIQDPEAKRLFESNGEASPSIDPEDEKVLLVSMLVKIGERRF
jgi:hypothetical protein